MPKLNSGFGLSFTKCLKMIIERKMKQTVFDLFDPGQAATITVPICSRPVPILQDLAGQGSYLEKT